MLFVDMSLIEDLPEKKEIQLLELFCVNMLLIEFGVEIRLSLLGENVQRTGTPTISVVTSVRMSPPNTNRYLSTLTNLIIFE